MRDALGTELLRAALTAALPMTGHALLAGGALPTPGDPEARSSITFRVGVDGQGDILFASAWPDVSEITELRLHAGGPGQDGGLLLTAAPGAGPAADLRAAPVSIPLGLLARLRHDPQGFHVLAVSAAGPVARGQLSTRRAQAWAAPTPDGMLGRRGSRDRSGLTLDFVSFDQVEVILAASAALGIGQIQGGAVRQGVGLATDPVVLDLTAALLAPDGATDTARATIASNREFLTRLLGRPAEFRAWLSYPQEGGAPGVLFGDLSTRQARFGADLHQAGGAIEVSYESLTEGRFRYVMADPVAAEVAAGKLYAQDELGAQTVLVDLVAANEAPGEGTNRIEGPLDVPEETLARMLAAPEAFAVDYQLPVVITPAPRTPLSPELECAAGHAPPIEGVWSGGIVDLRGSPTHTFAITGSMNVLPESPWVTFTGVPLACTEFIIPVVTVEETELATGQTREVVYSAVGRYEERDVTFVLETDDPEGVLDGQIVTGQIDFGIVGTTPEGEFSVELLPNEFRAVLGGIWIAEGNPDRVVRFEADLGGGFENSYTPISEAGSNPVPVRGIEVINGAVARQFEGTFDGTSIEIASQPAPEGGVHPAVTVTFVHANRILWAPAGGAPSVLVRAGS